MLSATEHISRKHPKLLNTTDVTDLIMMILQAGLKSSLETVLLSTLRTKNLGNISLQISK